MRKYPFLSGVFALLAVLSAGCAVAAALRFPGTVPILLKTPEAAVETADAFMAAVCAGDYTSAQQFLYGTPDLGADQSPETKVGAAVWEAFVDSTDYSLWGECYATQSGLAQDVTFVSLDMTSITDNLGYRAKALLEEKLAQAEDVSQIYDADNNFQEDLVMAVLETVTEEAIRSDSRFQEMTLTLQLRYQEGQWWILPEQALLNALFGGAE